LGQVIRIFQFRIKRKGDTAAPEQLLFDGEVEKGKKKKEKPLRFYLLSYMLWAYTGFTILDAAGTLKSMKVD